MAKYFIQIKENNELEKAKFCARCIFEKRGRGRDLIVPNFSEVALNNAFGQICVETDKTMEEVIAIMDKAKVNWAHICYPVKNDSRVIYNKKKNYERNEY